MSPFKEKEIILKSHVGIGFDFLTDGGEKKTPGLRPPALNAVSICTNSYTTQTTRCIEIALYHDLLFNTFFFFFLLFNLFTMF